MTNTFRSMAALGVLSAVSFSGTFVSGTAHAAKLTAADRAWIATCMTQRKESREHPGKLRKYCTCMQGVVDDTVTSPVLFNVCQCTSAQDTRNQ